MRAVLLPFFPAYPKTKKTYSVLHSKGDLSYLVDPLIFPIVGEESDHKFTS